MADNFGQVGSAFVALEADIKSFQDSLRAATPALQKIAGEAGKTIGNALDTEITKQVKLENLGKQLRSIGQEGQQLGSALSLGVTAPITAAGLAVVKFGSDFDDAMTESVAIMGDVSDAMRKDMASAAMEMGRTSSFSATEAAKAFYFLASAGYDAQASIAALPAVTRFAQAGAFDLAQATEFLADAQSSLGLRIKNDAVKNMENLVLVSDTLVEAGNRSNATVQQFAEALSNKAGAAIRLLGKDLTEGVAVLAAYADQGVKGEEAGEKLNMVFRDLQTATIKHNDAFQALNITVYDSQGNMQNMADIVGDMEKALASMSDEEKRTTLMTLGFQDRSVSAMQQLLGFSGAIRQYEKDLKSAGGVTGEIANKQMESMKKQLAVLGHQVEIAAIKFSEALFPILKDAVLPLLEDGIAIVSKFAEIFGQLPVPVQKFALAGVALAAALGPVVFLVSSLASNVGLAIITLSRFVPAAAAAGVQSTTLAAYMGTATTASFSLTAALGTLGATLSALVIPLAYAVLAYEIVMLAKATYDWAQAKRELVAAQKLEQSSMDKSIEELAKHGIIIDKTGKSENQLSEEISKGGQTRLAAIKAQEALTAATEKQGTTSEVTAKKVRALTEEEQKLIERFKAALTPADDLNKEIGLLASQGMKTSDILKIYGKTIVDAADSQREHGRVVTGLVAKLYDQAKAAIDAEDKARKLRDAVDNLKSTSTEAAEKAQALAIAIRELEAAGAPAGAILKLFGQQIKDTADNFEDMDAAMQDQAMSGIISQLQSLSQQGVDTDTIVKRLGPSILNLNSIINKSGRAVPSDLGIFSSLSLDTDAIDKQIEMGLLYIQDTASTLGKDFKIPFPDLMPPSPTGQWNEMTGKAVKSLTSMNDEASELGNSIRQLTAFGVPSAQIMELLGSNLDSAAKNSKSFKLALDPQTRALIEQREATQEAADEAKQWQEAWAHAMGQVAVDFAKGLTDVVFGATSFRSAMKGLAVETGKSFTETFFLEMTKPLQKLFSSWGTKLADLVGGLMSKITGGIGSKLGSILGIGGTVAKGGAGVAGSAAATGGSLAGGFGAAMGPAGSAGSIGILGLSGAATLGIGAAVAGAAMIANHFIGQGRKAADKFTGGSQAEFDRNLGNVVNEFNAQKGAGTLTVEKAEELRAQLGDVIGGITDSANQYAKEGKNQQKVVNQFFAAQDQFFGRNWSNLTGDFDATILELQKQKEAAAASAAAATGVNPDGTPMAGIPQTGLAQSASTLFSDTIKSLVPALTDFTSALLAFSATGGAAAPPIMVNIDVTNEFSFDVGNVSAMEIRDVIIPGITDVLETGIRGYREKWTQIISDQMNGIVSNVTATPA
jgi:TP901 family phage tail tape measure protein